jgi:hypothetical protein
MPTTRGPIHVIALAFLAYALVACTAPAEEALLPRSLDTHVAAVTDELFVAATMAEYLVDGAPVTTVIVYACDGADVAHWLVGMLPDDAVTLTGDDATVTLELHDDALTGTLTLAGGEPLVFGAARAEGTAGLFRAEASFAGVEHVGGWIVLNDGRQRGAVAIDGTVVANPTLDPVSGSATIDAGTLDAGRAVANRGGGAGKVSF